GGIASIGTLLGGRSAAHSEFYTGAPAYVFYGVFLCFPTALVFYWQSLRDGSRTLRLFALVVFIPPDVFSFSTGILIWYLAMFLSALVLRPVNCLSITSRVRCGRAILALGMRCLRMRSSQTLTLQAHRASTLRSPTSISTLGMSGFCSE